MKLTHFVKICTTCIWFVSSYDMVLVYIEKYD